MAVAKVFTAGGRDFDNKADAERHDAILTTKEELRSAVGEVMSDELQTLLKDCDAAMLPFAAKEYGIPESLGGDALIIIRSLTAEDVRRIHRVRQDVVIALAKAGAT